MAETWEKTVLKPKNIITLIKSGADCSLMELQAKATWDIAFEAGIRSRDVEVGDLKSRLPPEELWKVFCKQRKYNTTDTGY